MAASDSAAVYGRLPYGAAFSADGYPYDWSFGECTTVTHKRSLWGEWRNAVAACERY
ncbi:hypothetical protein D3C81_1741900 [compost metagenome]